LLEKINIGDRQDPRYNSIIVDLLPNIVNPLPKKTKCESIIKVLLDEKKTTARRPNKSKNESSSCTDRQRHFDSESVQSLREPMQNTNKRCHYRAAQYELSKKCSEMMLPLNDICIIVTNEREQ
jgi:hypothetical protein